MLLAGDEICHTQNGNNNAYCQDNHLSWLHWDLNAEQKEMLAFVQRSIELVNTEPVFQRRRFFHGQGIQGGEAPDIAWLDTSGNEMSEEDWKTSFVRSFGVELYGQSVDVDEHGEVIHGDTLLLLFNADVATHVDFTLPALENGQSYELIFDTAIKDEGVPHPLPGPKYQLTPCSMALLRLVEPKPTVEST